MDHLKDPILSSVCVCKWNHLYGDTLMWNDVEISPVERCGDSSNGCPSRPLAEAVEAALPLPPERLADGRVLIPLEEERCGKHTVGVEWV